MRYCVKRNFSVPNLSKGQKSETLSNRHLVSKEITWDGSIDQKMIVLRLLISLLTLETSRKTPCRNRDEQNAGDGARYMPAITQQRNENVQKCQRESEGRVLGCSPVNFGARASARRSAASG